VREVTLPLVSTLPDLERRKTLLKQQVEVAELQASLRTGSFEEQVHVFVLPEEFDMERIVAIFDVLRQILEERGDIQNVSGITFGDEVEIDGEISALPITLSITAHEEGLQTVHSLLKLAGTVTIADAVSTADLILLFQRTEAENPAAIVALEQFLSSDLLAYARDPRLSEDRIKKSFSSPGLQAILDELLTMSLLTDAKRILGGRVGEVLEQQELWPMPMITIEEESFRPGRSEGWGEVEITLRTYKRTN
jgi:hypothetical protein